MNKTFRMTALLLGVTLVVPLIPSVAQRKKQKAKARVETSADVKRLQENTQKEIKQTREKIRLNEQEVSRKLSELSKLGSEIEEGKKKVATSQKEVNRLQSEISSLESSIASETKSLNLLRAEYLRAVKKMRQKRKQTSALAFIFSARSFNEGMRRMRYLRQFGKWREKKSSEIESRVAALRQQTEQLSNTKIQHDKALKENLVAQNSLQKQYAAQDAIVVELKKNGQALREHLARKQSEANTLRNRVSALIAEEQRKAEADRKARQEAEAKRKAEQERKRQAELQAARQAEAERKAAEEKKIREEKLLAEAKTEKDKVKKQEKNKDKKQERKEDKKPVNSQSKKETKSKKEPKKDQKKHEKKRTEEVSYAEARGRKPRTQPPAQHNTEAPVPKLTTGGSFAGMKGALPRPVSGAFRITSRFGSNPLPDMPNVTYDNPGIDAQVARGAMATAVYPGTVSGVYMVPGYGTVIILNHDGYYTVYGNIAQSAVKVGDKVKQGHSLGKVGDDDDNPGHGLIHFEVWKNRDKQDPAVWIR